MDDLELDVRPILRGGGEPFAAIMAAVGRLQPGQKLRLVATFKPIPLFQVMARRGYESAPRHLEGGDWEVVFSPSAVSGEAGDGSGLDEVDTLHWPDPVRYLDCTELDPPRPMVDILAALEEMQAGEVLFALLGREPVFLIPELRNRGHAWVGNFDESGATYRLLVCVAGGGQA
ncbi:DUF2249 domain-containing protein [Devosia nitrariae]|uniref:Universal stress protein n=1 Tax=Devosia nitrariae TaxID=2071872 RepID=A0ABQ5W940_9HYPH|nr:DUF2249 domain-containing protein [Devosia nitrariae]GLQ56612.1 universal stress protein [Devosia nitrariae]